MNTQPLPDRRDAAPCACGGACDRGPTRREFLKRGGAGAAAFAALPVLAAPAAAPGDGVTSPDHFVPVEKNLDPKWIAALAAKGEPAWYGGDDLAKIAMPIGGIGAGQVYLTGDGRLVHWDIYNAQTQSGFGATNYQNLVKPVAPLRQGFAITVRPEGGQETYRTLDRQGFPGVRFRGEYPIGIVEYGDKAFPVAVTLEAFSPFIPLNAADSALPATVMHFTLKNTSDKPLSVALEGWLENGVCRYSGEVVGGTRENRVVKGKEVTLVLGSARAAPAPPEKRPPIVLADFERGDYGDWTAVGEAFGKNPAAGTLKGQQPVGGFLGKGLVNTFLDGDRPQGKLTSPAFKLERNFISFLIGGGRHAGQTCINLLVDGKIVRTAAGKDNERLMWHSWNVKDLAGKEARIEIVDAHSGPWGHINIDQIELRDAPRGAFDGPLDKQPDFGTMALAVLGASQNTTATASMPDDRTAPAAAGERAEQPFDKPLCMAAREQCALAPGEQKQVTFVIAWHFPNRPQRGNFYATRFADAAAVVEHVARDVARLAGQTRLWRATWYDSSLPVWLLDRLFSTVSILATGTCQWWANGRFWAWEGVGCCHGTCAHVWNYEHAMARLFPELERSVREMQDFEPEAGFDADTGAVRFRGENWKQWAGDSQGGTALKAYREHLCSADAEFLKRNWPRIRKTIEFLIDQDGDADGLIEGKQHNTYDIDFYGANTMVGSLYLGALRAGEEMAKELGDAEFAARCRRVFEAGRRATVEKLFNGEYFVQQVDLQKHPKHQYADGCLADQLFGQGWAHQVALGYVYPPDKVTAALQAIWKYDWAPDIGPQNKVHPPQRWFARPGEAGLFTCTWPKSKHLGPDSVLYRDEVWTGIEYQVAGHMAWERMTTEALAICRGVHDRYQPAKHNPYNEVECGDHYARAMASHGVFLALCGFEYHGPRGQLGFAPRLAADDFRAAFTAAEGWGTISQRRQGKQQTQGIAVLWGKLRLTSLTFELPEGAKLDKAAVSHGGKPLPATASQDGRRVTISLAAAAVVASGESLQATLRVA